jgi:hypothetical protein
MKGNSQNQKTETDKKSRTLHIGGIPNNEAGAKALREKLYNFLGLA